MGHILHSRLVSSDDRLLPAQHFRDLTVCQVEWPFAPRCKQELPMAGDFLRTSVSHGAVGICESLETKQGHWPKHSTQTRRSLLLSPWDACPYIKMWFGALTGTQWGEAGWEGLGLQCKPQTHSLPPALPSCSQLYYIHSCWCVCDVCACAVFG